MLLFRQFLSELDDTLTQYSPVWCIGSRALSFSDPYFQFTCLSVLLCVILSFCLSATSELNISETRWTAYINVPIGYPLDTLRMTSRDRMTSYWWRHHFSLKCFFFGNSCQNWTIFEHNVPLYGVSIWSSRIVDPGLMTSLMTSSGIIIVANLKLNISETTPDSGMVSTYSE